MNTSNFSESFSSGFSPLLSLVYVSASTYLMEEEELEDILRRSRENNSQLRLTGMLLYYDGAFMQVLEGPENAVRQMYAHISQDPRHRRIIPLLEEYIPERSFSNWAMGFHRLKADEASHLDGFSSFAEIDQFLEYFKGKPKNSMLLLKSFRDSTKR